MKTLLSAFSGRGAHSPFVRLALFVTISLFSSAAHAGSCCKTQKPSPPAAAPLEFTRNSLYQLDATFTDDAGRPFTLAQLRGKPVVLAMFFASCTYACPLIVADITRVRDALPAELRNDVQLVLISFDTARDTPDALRKYRDDRLLDAQWTLARGDDDAVAELAALLGVKFKRESDGQFAHSNLLTILNAQGEIVHQRTGLQGGLVDAAAALVATAR